jgi:hypothetical protein
MLKKLLLIGAFALLPALNAKARIGYTLDECIKQYGTPVEDDGSEQNNDIQSVRLGSNYHEPVKIFTVDGIKIYAGFNRGVVITEVVVFPNAITFASAKAFLSKVTPAWKKKALGDADGVDTFNAKLSSNGHSLIADFYLDTEDVNLIGKPFKYNSDAVEKILLTDQTAIKEMHDDLDKQFKAKSEKALGDL